MVQLEVASRQSANTNIARPAASARISVIDQLRGLAMILMALEHSAFFAKVNVRAESFGGLRPDLSSLPHILIGMFTHQASGIFFTLTGVSVSFFENSQRKRGRTEGQISRFLLVRALILLVLDLVVSVFAWQQPITFDVLSAVALNLVVLAFVRRLPLKAIVIGAIGLFVTYPLLVQLFPYQPDQPLSTLTTILVGYRGDAAPYVEFAALSRLSLVLVGYVAGRLLQEGGLAISPRLLWVALAGLVVSFALRLAGGYGNFLPYQQGWPLIYFFIENKQPPSMVFLLTNFSIALVFLVALNEFQHPIKDNVGTVLATFGQTSLFFYVAHLFLYSRIISQVVPTSFLPQGTGLFRLFFECALGLIILFPVCKGYRYLRQKYPNSILRYV